jgi:hypothetical protein
VVISPWSSRRGHLAVVISPWSSRRGHLAHAEGDGLEAQRYRTREGASEEMPLETAHERVAEHEQEEPDERKTVEPRHEGEHLVDIAECEQAGYYADQEYNRNDDLRTQQLRADSTAS